MKKTKNKKPNYFYTLGSLSLAITIMVMGILLIPMLNEQTSYSTVVCFSIIFLYSIVYLTYKGLDDSGVI